MHPGDRFTDVIFFFFFFLPFKWNRLFLLKFSTQGWTPPLQMGHVLSVSSGELGLQQPLGVSHSTLKSNTCIFNTTIQVYFRLRTICLVLGKQINLSIKCFNTFPPHCRRGFENKVQTLMLENRMSTWCLVNTFFVFLSKKRCNCFTELYHRGKYTKYRGWLCYSRLTVWFVETGPLFWLLLSPNFRPSFPKT